MSESLPQAGDILAGKYRIEGGLGSGGMGVVVRAHHLLLDEPVAIKFLRPEAAKDAAAVARFDREARAAVKIKSEHVARVIDVGRLDDGAPYMVMEFLDGRDLSGWIRDHGALPIEQAVEFVLQACEAIAEAHALGIVHRDLKPANLFCVMRSDGLYSIKVLDFGISKLTSAASSDMSMTRTQGLMGSPAYMSPEQMQSTKGVDVRTDIWALGVILYQLIVGAPPFEGETFPELVLNIVNTRAPEVRARRPDVSPAFQQVIERCLEKDRENRYANVAELAQALVAHAPARAAASVGRITRVIQNAGLSTSGSGMPPAMTGGTVAERARTAIVSENLLAPFGGVTPARPVEGGDPAPVPVVTVPSWGRTASPSVVLRGEPPPPMAPTAGQGARMFAWSALAVVVAVGCAGTVLVAKRLMTRDVASSPSPSAPPTVADVPSAPPVASAAQAPAEAPSATATQPTPTTPVVVPPPSSEPKPLPLSTDHPLLVHAASATPLQPAKPVCRAVEYLDDQGNQHFKPVCK